MRKNRGKKRLSGRIMKKADKYDFYYEEEEYYADDAYYEEENEYGADDAFGEEISGYYADDACYEEEGGYYADDACYEEEGGYYADDACYEEEGGYCADDACYEEEGGYCADDAYYEEDGEYYTDDAGEWHAGAADNSYYEDGEYDYGDDWEEAAYVAEEEEYYGHSRRGTTAGKSRSARAGTRMKKGLWGRLAHMSAMDRIVASTGVLVLIFALITCTLYVDARVENKQVSSFASVGTQLDGIQVIGESGLLAIADAQSAQMAAAEQELQSETAGEDTKEEQSGSVTVVMKLSSIQKDLKIKFANQKSGKLIASVPFEVTVTGADNKSYTMKDDDQDGIIYRTDLAPGDYRVSMNPLSGYEDYQISAEQQTIKVKDQIEYKKVDVSDEVKKESEVNAAKEDTGKKEATVESALTDTVGWVESTATPLDGTDADAAYGYVEVPKDKITDPSTRAGLGFLRFSEPVPLTETDPTLPPAEDTAPPPSQPPSLSLNSYSLTLEKGGNATLSAAMAPDGGSLSWSSSNSSVASVTDGTVTGIAGGTASITATYQVGDQTASAVCGVTVNEPAPAAPAISLNTASGTIAIGATLQLSASVTNPADPSATSVSWTSGNGGVASVSGGTVTGVGAGTTVITAYCDADPSVTAACTVTVTARTAVSISASTASLAVGKTLQLTAGVANTDNPAVIWASTPDSVATVSSDGTVTGRSAGTAVITATSAADSSAAASCTVTVTDASKPKISMDQKTVTLLTGKTVQLNAAVTDTDNKEIFWNSTPDAVATVSQDGRVTGVAPGTAVIRAACKAEPSVYVECSVTVKLNPDIDKNTKLKDNDGNQLYIKNSSGVFVEAVAADYYTADKFYKKGSVDPSKFKYTGWQTLDGRTYYFDADGNKITGEQIIQGAKYNFNSDGSLNTGSGVMGIDVSKWNGSINWNEVRNSGVSYVIIRCAYRGSTTGALIEDPMFRSNIKGAAAAGLKVGVYFFTQAVSEAEAIGEASMALDLVRGYKLDYPIFLDVESSGGRGDAIDADTRTKVCQAFCRTIQNSGYKTGVYANKTWLSSKLSAASLANYKIWLAQYAAAPSYNSTKIDLWQYTSKGSIAGIQGNVDLNISYMGY